MLDHILIAYSILATAYGYLERSKHKRSVAWRIKRNFKHRVDHAVRAAIDYLDSRQATNLSLDGSGAAAVVHISPVKRGDGKVTVDITVQQLFTGELTGRPETITFEIP